MFSVPFFGDLVVCVCVCVYVRVSVCVRERGRECECRARTRRCARTRSCPSVGHQVESNVDVNIQIIPTKHLSPTNCGDDGKEQL